MALTVTLEKEWKEGKLAHAIVKITFDASYLTGGESLDLSAYMKNIWYIDGKITEDDAGYVLGFDDSDFDTSIALCELFWTGAGLSAVLAEVTGNMSAVSARIHAFGDAN